MTPAQNPMLCRAWLGYAVDPQTADVVARVCARCRDREAAELEAARIKVAVTHGICPTCAGVQLELLD